MPLHGGFVQPALHQRFDSCGGTTSIKRYGSSENTVWACQAGVMASMAKPCGFSNRDQSRKPTCGHLFHSEIRGSKRTKSRRFIINNSKNK
ncbi:hypothetical protein Hanom_Chr12g01136041 [Helianthus anomalus]